MSVYFRRLAAVVGASLLVVTVPPRSFAAAPSADPSPPVVLVNGRIVDAATTRPILGAQVTVGLRSTWSKRTTIVASAEGKFDFRLPVSQADELLLIATAPGYRSTSHRQAIRSEPQSLQIALNLTRYPVNPKPEPPPSPSPAGSIMINQGASVTGIPEVTLTFTPPATGSVTGLALSLDGQRWLTPQGVVFSRPWSLTSGDGDKTVYVTFYDRLSEAWSEPVGDTIRLDTTPTTITTWPVDVPFTTRGIPKPDTTPPKIRDVRVVDVTQTQAAVVWTTDEPATSEVEYGTDTRYGAVAVDPTPRRPDHRVPLIGLLPKTEYHIRVRSSDAAWNEAVGNDVSFTTAPAEPPPNHPPTAKAGDKQTVASGSVVKLDGSRSSDPDGDPLTYRWTQTAGPPVSLTSPDQPQSQFIAPTVTTTTRLEFVLTVADGRGGDARDTIGVTVTAPARPPQPPEVEAGQNQTIAFPGYVTLQGTASDQDTPPNQLKILWRWSSTDGESSINDPTSLSTTATFSKPGRYTFWLDVSDGMNTVTDSLTVTVTGTLEGYRLTVSPTTIQAGAPNQQWAVTWGAPADQVSTLDWIGLYVVGASFDAVLAFRSTFGQPQGQTTFAAPVATGTYEFRYYRNRDSKIFALSNPVNAVNGPSLPPTQQSVTTPPSVQPPSTTPPTTIQPPSTQPQPPSTQPPSTTPPATQPPSTQPPGTQPPPPPPQPTEPPARIVINNGARYTNKLDVMVRFELSPNAWTPTAIALSRDKERWSESPFQTTLPWPLALGPTEDGPKIVYAKFRHPNGTWSRDTSESITLDTIAPKISITFPRDGDIIGAP